MTGVDNGSTAPRLDASAATTTSVEALPRYAQPPRPSARISAGSRHRSQPSRGKSARMVLICRCAWLIQTLSLPETARTYACSRSSSHPRRVRVGAVDTIPRHPRQPHTRLERALQHLPSQHRFGGKRPLVGNTGAATALAIPLRMYAERKAWPLRAVHVDVRFKREGKEGAISRVLSFEGELDDEQRARLADIAERTPVTLTLK